MQLRMQTREFLHKFPRESQEALYTKKGSTRIHLISVVVDGKKRPDCNQMDWKSLCWNRERVASQGGIKE